MDEIIDVLVKKIIRDLADSTIQEEYEKDVIDYQAFEYSIRATIRLFLVSWKNQP